MQKHQPNQLRVSGRDWRASWPWFCRKPDSHVERISSSLVDFKSRERNGAFGLAARVGEMGRGQRIGRKAQWSGGFGNSSREHHRGSASLAVFGGVVCKGKPKPDSLARRGKCLWPSHGFMKRKCSLRNGAKIKPMCGQPLGERESDAVTERGCHQQTKATAARQSRAMGEAIPKVCATEAVKTFAALRRISGERLSPLWSRHHRAARRHWALPQILRMNFMS
jgi:hypothetical protein